MQRSYLKKQDKIDNNQWFQHSRTQFNCRECSKLSNVCTYCTKQKPENWVSYQNNRPKKTSVRWVLKRWVPKLPQLPSEILRKIISHTTPISELKFRSTCQAFHNTGTQPIRETILKLINDQIIHIEQLVVTHLVSNIPFDLIHRDQGLHAYVCSDDVHNVCINLSKLAVKKLANDYWYVELPSTKCEAFKVGYQGKYCNGPIIYDDSELFWGRQEIVDTLPFKPIHTAHISNWTGKSAHSNVVLVCTGPFVFSKKVQQHNS